MKSALVKIKSYLSMSFPSFAQGLTTIIVLALLSFTLLNNIEAYAQIFPIRTNTTSTTVTPSHPPTLQQGPQQPSSQPNLHLVKITSPIKEQVVPIGKDLRISGTSLDNTTTTTSSGCSVSVKVNGINPYHNASQNGPGGKGYSNWNFTLSPSYTVVKQGQNKITAKFSCTSNPSLLSHYSVNVTGVAKTMGSNSTTTNSVLPVSSNATSPVSSNATSPVSSNATSHVSSNATSHVSSNATSPVSSNATSPGSSKSASAAKPILKNKNHNFNVLSVSLHLDKNSLHPGDKQTITIRVLDKNSSNTVGGASVVGRITSPVGLFKKVGGTTDDSGKASYYWTVKDGDTTGKYKITTDISAPGYEKYSATKTFKVIPIPVTTPQYNSFPSTRDNTNTNTNTKHHNNNHLPTIIPSTHDSTNTIANNNNNIVPPPSNTIPSTNSPVTLPNNNNNIVPPPSNTVTTTPDEKVPFLLPFH
ncbi:MAG TPA: hypothetical protein VFI73_01720 [Candidatus Nitrosopolaris sp.]|nr:hypothetical protein [Candidatus Nitrosopolaris sp.]